MVDPELLRPFMCLTVVFLMDLTLGSYRALSRKEFRLSEFCKAFSKLGRWFVIFGGCAFLKSGLAGNYLLDFAGGIESGIILAEAASVLRTLSVMFPDQFPNTRSVIDKFSGSRNE